MQNSKKTIFRREGAVLLLSRLYSFLRSEQMVSSISLKRKYHCILSLAILLGAASCSPAKKNVYFRNLQRDTTLHNIVTPNFELKIRKGDLLGISVASLSPDVAFYNAAQGSSSGSSNGASANGYPVDENGNISFVKLGTMHVEGMTRKELKDTLEKGLIPYLKEGIVTVSFQNRHVTMLGGIGSQVLPMAGDNMTILDAMAASGDIGDKGRIDNVLVIRDTGSTGSAKVFKRLNLEDNSIFSSPYYYLQPNDIVYVEPARVKTPLSTPQVITYITSGISLIFLIVNALKL